MWVRKVLRPLQLGCLPGGMRLATTSSSSSKSTKEQSRGRALVSNQKDSRYALLETVISPPPPRETALKATSLAFDEEQDEVISRAWMLARHDERERVNHQIQRRAEVQWRALDRLKKIRPLLYQVAVSKGSVAGELVVATTSEAGKSGSPEVAMVEKNKAVANAGPGTRVGGIFPIDLKIPTETPSRQGWNYGWKA